MSREIKFRAWDQKDKKYLLPEKQGFVILPTMPSFGVTIPYENHSNPGNIDEDCIDWADADLLMGRYELEQYTGLKDKNGKEIYEGDILGGIFEGCYIGWCDTTKSFELFNCYEHYCMACDGDILWCELSDSDIDLEVIGNIHENPELLGGEE